MARRSRPRHVLAAASLLLAGWGSALPSEANMVAQREVVHDAPSPWVTVDASGQARTITPTVTSVNGAATTISPPPDALTQTVTYTLSPTSAAAAATSTGPPPVATASSSSGAGAFLACNVYQGVDAPFCQPQSGSQLNPGKTYYGGLSPVLIHNLQTPPLSPKNKTPTYTPQYHTVTWSDTYFSNASTAVEVQGTYHDGSGAGFTSPRVAAGTGFYAWTIDGTLLDSPRDGGDRPASSLRVSLALASFQDLYGGALAAVPGPTVLVVASTAAQEAGSGAAARPNAAAIAVPVVALVVVLPLAALAVRSWRRRRGDAGPVLGAPGGRHGYGVRQNRARRAAAGGEIVVGRGPVDDKKAGGVAGAVELTDRDSWSPATSPAGDGRNVFREEVERQERER